MTYAEARIFLNADAFEDLQDAYDQLLFEQKQFFLLKTCVPKVFLSKLEKLSLFQQAAQLLEVEKHGEEPVITSFQFPNEVTLLDCLRTYTEVMKDVKKEISGCSCFTELKLLVKIQIEVFLAYASRWPVFFEFKEVVKLGIEPNPVSFFQELKHLESIGITTFEGLVESDSSVGFLVKQESTRLFTLINSGLYA